jgi:hypothetical protein
MLVSFILATPSMPVYWVPIENKTMPINRAQLAINKTIYSHTWGHSSSETAPPPPLH